MLYFAFGLSVVFLIAIFFLYSKWKVAEAELRQSAQAQEDAVTAERKIWETRLNGENARWETERSALLLARDEAEKNFNARMTHQEEQHQRQLQEMEEHCGERIRIQLRQFEESRTEVEKQQATRDALLQEQFKTLSNQILEERTGQLRNANQEQLGLLLKPLQEKLDTFKSTVENTHARSVELNGEMKSQLEHMLKSTQSLQQEANQLTAALRGDNKTQGNWGEMILEDILKRSGLQRGIHYECQEVLKDDAGRMLQNDANNRMRPDVIVHYPDGKDVIIDSKVSLSAFTTFVNSTDEAEKAKALKAHLQSVRNHVAELVRKNYQAYIEKMHHEAVDFVIMFIPNEAPHQLAMQEDPTLWREAFRQKVLIVSPVNLMALLQIIQIAWTRADQERNQQEILKTAGALLDRLYSFYEEFDAVGEQLERAKTAFHKATGRLKGGDGKHSVVISGEQLKKLGVRMKKEKNLPPELIPDSGTGALESPNETV